MKAYDLADAEGEWNILHHARWGGFDAPLNCARHQPGGRDGGLRQEPLTEVRIRFLLDFTFSWKSSSRPEHIIHI